MIEVQDLHKKYGNLEAVRGISFTVRKGTCFGLLGPNGAGKTTTLEMIEAITRPSAGTILFNGEPLGNEYAERIGIQFQNTALQEYQTVQETLALFAALYKTTVDLTVLAERCQLAEFLQQDTRLLSGGQRQRLLLAVALVNDPELIFLDEPTTGLDPQSRRHFWTLIDAIRSAGTTIILTTHYMEEAEQLCDELAIIDHGLIIASGTPASLLSEHFSAHVIRLPLEALSDPDAIPLKIRQQKDEWEIYIEDVSLALQILGEHQVCLDQFQVAAPTLEDLFLKLTGQALRS